MSEDDLISNSTMSGVNCTLDSESDSGVSSEVSTASISDGTAIVSLDVARFAEVSAPEVDYDDNEQEDEDNSGDNDESYEDDLGDACENIFILAGVEVRGPPSGCSHTLKGSERPHPKPASSSGQTAGNSAKPVTKDSKKVAPTPNTKR